MDPVIMLPGLGSASSVWGRTIAEPGPDYECRVGDTLSDASLTSMAERVLDDAPDRFALAGVSMGGMIAMTIMRLAPERVTRLALFDTNARADTPEQASRPSIPLDSLRESPTLVLQQSRLDRDAVNLGTGAHVFCLGKGRKERRTPLNRQARAALQKWLKEPARGSTAACFPMRAADVSAPMPSSFFSPNM